MIEFQNVISIINLIAIIILFYIVLTKSKESFDGAPSGYDNLLLSDDDGNLSTFSISTLQTDIQSMIDDSLKNYWPKAAIDATNQDIYNKISANEQKFNNYYTKTEVNNFNNNFVNYGSPIFMTNMHDGMGLMYGNGGNIAMKNNNSSQNNGYSNTTPQKSTGFIINKAPAWDNGSGTVWKN